MDGWRREEGTDEGGERGSCRALGASAAALILHYGLGAMNSYFGELADIKEEMERKTSACCIKPESVP